MKFAQKALLFHRASFDFGDKYLDYRIEDEKACAGFSVLYENINADKALQSYREKGPIYLTFVVYAAALLSMVLLRTHHGSNPFSALTWTLLVLTIVLTTLAKRMKFDSTVFTTPLGKLIIFDRAQHDEIVAEILRRRTAEIRRKFMPIDFLNDAKAEIRKFRWLMTEGIISEDEFNSAVASISATARTEAP